MGRKSKTTITNKRRSRVTPTVSHLGANVTLERVLGLTTQNDASLSCCPCSGCVAYAAGCVIVIFNPRKNKQEYIFNVSRKTLTALAFSQDGKHLVSGECGHNPAVRVWDVHEKTEVCQFTGHKFGISCVVFSPESGYIVSVGEEHDMVVNVWDWKRGVRVSSGKIATMVAHIAFSEDGNTFVTVGNRSVKFWYFTGKSKTRQTLPLRGRNSILGEQKNNLFCSITFGRGISSNKVYAITKSGLLCEFNEDRMLDKWVELRTRQAYCITASNNHLFVGCADGVMRIFSAETLHFVTSLPKPHHTRIDVAAGTDKDHIFSPKENVRYPDTVATALDNYNMKLTCIYGDHSLYIWDIHDIHKIGKQWSFLYHSSCILGIDIYPEVTNGNKVTLPPNTFSTCASDNTVKVWNVDPAMDSTIFGKNIYSPDLLKILYMEDEDAIDERTSSEGKEGVRSLCFSPDGHVLASGDKSGNIRINDLLQTSMSQLHKIEAHDSEVLCLEFSQPHTGYNLLASASRDRFIHIFDMNNNCSLLQTIHDHSASITGVKFAESNGRFQMISCGADKALLFRIATLNPGLQFNLLHHVVSKTTLYDMAVDVSKKYVAVACQDRNLRIHNILSGKLKQTYKGSQSEDGTLIKVELDPSGMYSATSCSDKTLAIYDFYSGACMATMMGHSELVTGLKFTNDCRQLISVSGDGCIFVWKLPFEMTNNMIDIINERTLRLKEAAQINQVSCRRETFVIPPEPLPLHVEAPTADNDDTESQNVQDGDSQPDYRFSTGELPLWAQKKVTGEDLPSPEIYCNPALPRGKWAQKLGSEGFSMMSRKTAIPVRIQDCVDKRRYTLESESMSDGDDDDDDDDDFGFGPAEERLKMFGEMDSKESPPDSPQGQGYVKISRGSDVIAIDGQSSNLGEDGVGDEKSNEEEEVKEEDEDVQEVIFYPDGDPSANECLDFQVTAVTLSIEELARKKHKRSNSKEILANKEKSSKEIGDQTEEVADVISAEPSDDEDDSTPDVTPVSSPIRKHKPSLTSPEDEEKFLHDHFDYFAGQSFDECFEEPKDIKGDDEIGRVFDRRLSFSGKFIQQTRIDPSFKSRAGDGSLVLQESSITSIAEVKTPPTTPSASPLTITIPSTPVMVTSGNSDDVPTTLNSESQHGGGEDTRNSVNDANITQDFKSKSSVDGKEEDGNKKQTGVNRVLIIKETNAEIIPKLTVEIRKAADEIDSGQISSGLDRPTNLKLPRVIPRHRDNVPHKQDQKATDLLHMKIKMKTDEVVEVQGKPKMPSKEELYKHAIETSSRKRSSSLSKLPIPDNSSETTEIVQPASRLRSQSSERQSNPPNLPIPSARQKHRSRQERRASAIFRSYESGTESANAKIKKKVGPGADPPLQKLKRKRHSLPISGPIKATEDAIRPSAERRERSEDVKTEDLKKPEHNIPSKEVKKEGKDGTTTENHIDECRTAPSKDLYKTDTNHARRDNSTHSLVVALEESIKHVKENFCQSLATLTELQKLGNVVDFNKGLESLSLTCTSMGDSLESLKMQQTPTSSSLTINGSADDKVHQRMKLCLSTFLHPGGTNGTTTSDGDKAAQAAIDLLDQYSSMLVTLVQTKLDNENIPDDVPVEKEIIVLDM